MEKFDSTDEVYYHEISHLVIARLIALSDEDFPAPTYLEIKENGFGEIDGGHITDPFESYRTMNLRERVAEIYYLIVGYLSRNIFIDPDSDNLVLEEEEAAGRKSDVEKLNRIIGNGIVKGGTIRSVSDEDHYWYFNDSSLSVLNPFKQEVLKLLQNNAVKEAIEFGVSYIKARHKDGELLRLEGEGLQALIQGIDERLIPEIAQFKVIFQNRFRILNTED